MKKLLIVAVAFATTAGAYAQANMVRFYGWDGGNRTQSVDLSKSTNDADAKTDWTHINLNYARAFGQIQVGVTFETLTGESGGNDVGAQTIGLSGYYNLGKDLTNTCYVALHYNMTTYSDGGADVGGFSANAAEDDKQTDIVLEYGHRFNLGKAWGMNLTYAPRVTYAMSTFSDDSADEDTATSTLGWDFLKFDVLF